MTTLTEKELSVIERIGNNSGRITQRQIAIHTGLSLGLTNLILKRLAKKGYIKVRQLTPKKMHYMLTRKGITQKAKKSYNYIFRTISEIQRIRNIIRQLIASEYEKGNRVFGVFGDGEFIEVIEICCRDFPDVKIKRLDNVASVKNANDIDIILNCENDFRARNNITRPRIINLIDYIASHKG